MIDSEVKSLNDLNNFRSAPTLTTRQSQILFKELSLFIDNADWFTIGIMAPSCSSAISALRNLENCFSWTPLNILDFPSEEGPVFLKANQKSGDVYVRVEYGLGQGILLTCHHKHESKVSGTYGPFPLGFFGSENIN